MNNNNELNHLKEFDKNADKALREQKKANRLHNKMLAIEEQYLREKAKKTFHVPQVFDDESQMPIKYKSRDQIRAERIKLAKEYEVEISERKIFVNGHFNDKIKISAGKKNLAVVRIHNLHTIQEIEYSRKHNMRIDQYGKQNIDFSAIGDNLELGTGRRFDGELDEIYAAMLGDELKSHKEESMTNFIKYYRSMNLFHEPKGAPIVVLDCLFAISPDIWEACDDEDKPQLLRAWCASTFKFARKRFQGARFGEMVVHIDEPGASPHIHLHVCPVVPATQTTRIAGKDEHGKQLTEQRPIYADWHDGTKKRKLMASKKYYRLSEKMDYSIIQSEYAAYLRMEGFNVQRGLIRTPESGLKHKKVAQHLAEQQEKLAKLKEEAEKKIEEIMLLNKKAADLNLIIEEEEQEQLKKKD